MVEAKNDSRLLGRLAATCESHASTWGSLVYIGVLWASYKYIYTMAKANAKANKRVFSDQWSSKLDISAFRGTAIDSGSHVETEMDDLPTHPISPADLCHFDKK